MANDPPNRRIIGFFPCTGAPVFSNIRLRYYQVQVP
jgi:hypothetical protein